MPGMAQVHRLARIYIASLLIIFVVTVVPTKSGSDVIFCLQLLSKTITCTSIGILWSLGNQYNVGTLS